MVNFPETKTAKEVKVGDVILQPYPMRVQRSYIEKAEVSRVEYIRFECVPLEGIPTVYPVGFGPNVYYYGLLSHNPVVMFTPSTNVKCPSTQRQGESNE